MKKEEALSQLPLLEELEQLVEDYQSLLQEVMMELEKTDPSSTS